MKGMQTEGKTGQSDVALPFPDGPSAPPLTTEAAWELASKGLASTIDSTVWRICLKSSVLAVNSFKSLNMRFSQIPTRPQPGRRIAFVTQSLRRPAMMATNVPRLNIRYAFYKQKSKRDDIGRRAKTPTQAIRMNLDTRIGRSLGGVRTISEIVKLAIRLNRARTAARALVFSGNRDSAFHRVRSFKYCAQSSTSTSLHPIQSSKTSSSNLTPMNSSRSIMAKCSARTAAR